MGCSIRNCDTIGIAHDRGWSDGYNDRMRMPHSPRIPATCGATAAQCAEAYMRGFAEGAMERKADKDS